MSTYMKVAKYEMKEKDFEAARRVFEKAAEDLGLD